MNEVTVVLASQAVLKLDRKSARTGALLRIGYRQVTESIFDYS